MHVKCILELERDQIRLVEQNIEETDEHFITYTSYIISHLER